MEIEKLTEENQNLLYTNNEITLRIKDAKARIEYEYDDRKKGT
jgi:hypothetical protein